MSIFQVCDLFIFYQSCKLILKRNMFYGGFKQENEIEVPNVDYGVFIALVTFLYTGKVRVTADNLLDLMLLSDQYQGT
jgi:hypothetical protein